MTSFSSIRIRRCALAPAHDRTTRTIPSRNSRTCDIKDDPSRGYMARFHEHEQANYLRAGLKKAFENKVIVEIPPAVAAKPQRDVVSRGWRGWSSRSIRGIGW